MGKNKCVPIHVAYTWHESPKRGLSESPSTMENGGEMSLKMHFFSRAGVRGPACKMGQWDIPQNFLGLHGMSHIKRCGMPQGNIL
jgi:hypothetical protein